eukprot:GHUV01028420.1.p1 GENE.GHUV01028420.1~~GHUV01028420.1.p1  ORF type:complete len:115 (+),score=12.67 GHUV01028420.1:1006-1350(+)
MVRGDPDFNEMEESDSGSDDEPAPKPRGRKPAAAPSKPRRAPKRPAGLVNLRSLIDEGLLTPAEDVLTVEYKGTITHASLAPDGRIRWKGIQQLPRWIVVLTSNSTIWLFLLFV